MHNKAWNTWAASIANNEAGKLVLHAVDQVLKVTDGNLKQRDARIAELEQRIAQLEQRVTGEVIEWPVKTSKRRSG
jgi:hypothetical protein